MFSSLNKEVQIPLYGSHSLGFSSCSASQKPTFTANCPYNYLRVIPAVSNTLCSLQSCGPAAKLLHPKSFWMVPSRFTLLDGDLLWEEVKITADVKLVNDKEIKEPTLPKNDVLVGRYPGS